MWEATEQCRVNTSVEWKRGGPPATFDVIAFLVAAAVVVDIIERHPQRLDVVERARRKSAVCLASIIIVVAATVAATTRIWIRITNDGAPDRGRISEVLARHVVVVFVFVSVCLADKEVSISVVSPLVLIVSYGPRCVDSSVKMASGIPRNYCIIFKRSSHRSCSIR